MADYVFEQRFMVEEAGWTLRGSTWARLWLEKSKWRWTLTAPDGDVRHFNSGLDLALSRLAMSSERGGVMAIERPYCAECGEPVEPGHPCGAAAFFQVEDYDLRPSCSWCGLRDAHATDCQERPSGAGEKA